MSLPEIAGKTWWAEFGGTRIAFSLPHAPELETNARRFLTADVQTTAPGGEADFELSTTDAPSPPAPADTFEVDGMVASWSPTTLWLGTKAGVLVGDGPRFRLHRRPGDVNSPYDPIMAVLGHVGAQNGWNSLHAGLVHSPAGALLLIGESGKGKSTTSAACMAMGWPVDSDDVTFMQDAGDCISGLGLPRVLSVPDEAVPDSHRGVVSSSVDHRDRRSVRSFERIGGWHPVVAVIEVDHGFTEESELQSISQLEVIQGLLRNQAIAGSLPGQDQQLSDMLGTLAALPIRRLALGVEPASRQASIQRELISFAAELRAIRVGANR